MKNTKAELSPWDSLSRAELSARRSESDMSAFLVRYWARVLVGGLDLDLELELEREALPGFVVNPAVSAARLAALARLSASPWEDWVGVGGGLV